MTKVLFFVSIYYVIYLPVWCYIIRDIFFLQAYFVFDIVLVKPNSLMFNASPPYHAAGKEIHSDKHLSTSFTIYFRKYILIRWYFIYDIVMVKHNNLMVNISPYHATDIEFHSEVGKTFCHTGIFKTSNFPGS